jgi:hypothetical protein
LVRRELPEPEKVGHLGMRSDADQAGPVRRGLTEAVQQKHQDRLIEQVVFEPEHHLVLSPGPGKGQVTPLQPGQDLGLSQAEPRTEPGGAFLPSGAVVRPFPQRTLAEGVVPRGGLTRKPGVRQSGENVLSTTQVQHRASGGGITGPSD